MIGRACTTSAAMDPAGRGEELHQVLRQGRAQGDVQDGRVHRGIASPGRRSSRPSASARSWSRSTSPARSAGSPASASTRSPTEALRLCHAVAYPSVPQERPTARWISAASTSGGARASTTCSIRPRCSSSSTRTRTPALRHLQGVHASGGRPVGAPRDASRPVQVRRGTHARAHRGGGAGERHRQALLHRRHVLRARSPRRRTRLWPSR